jgi:hypothetical protein
MDALFGTDQESFATKTVSSRLLRRHSEVQARLCGGSFLLSSLAEFCALCCVAPTGIPIRNLRQRSSFLNQQRRLRRSRRLRPHHLHRLRRQKFPNRERWFCSEQDSEQCWHGNG